MIMKLYLITHSHGSNVGIFASQLLTKNTLHKSKIETIFAFGTPVDPESYFPAMNIIHYFYNFFSYSDFVQTVLWHISTHLPEGTNESLIFLSRSISMQPNHDIIHHPLIAQWLPKMHACFDNL